MENIANNFYRHFYLKTGGYLPVKPLTEVLFPGDFFKIIKGEIVVLGNIFRDIIISKEDAAFNTHRLNSINWNFSDGVSKPYTARGSANSPTDGEFLFSKQILAFSNRGSFTFHAEDVDSTLIINWEDIKQQLIISLTQTRYSFRELYIVTESVSAKQWNLAIAGAENAEMEIAIESENYENTDFLGNESAKIIQSKDIDIYLKETTKKPYFFKAKKITIQEDKIESLVQNFTNQRIKQNEWAANFYDFSPENISLQSLPLNMHKDISILEMLPANELNPTTALLYLRWTDMTLEDVEKLST